MSTARQSKEAEAKRLELIAYNLRGEQGPASAVAHLYARYSEAANEGRLLERSFAPPSNPVWPRLPGAVDRLTESEWEAARREVERAHTLGARIVAWSDPEYPESLKESLYPPPVVYVKGTLLPLDRAAVAVVGSRKSEPEYVEFAYELSYELARRGVTIVSGLARGVDRAAHEGALAAGGRTLAVLAHGIDTLYPRSHAPLAEAIAKRGALLTFFPVGTAPLPFRFPARNWVVAALSLGVVVVRGGVRSGALITANFGAAQGRGVMAVPGHIHHPLSKGPNTLLQEGAGVVLEAEDVLAHLADAFYGAKVELKPVTSLPEASDGSFNEGADGALRRAVRDRLTKGPIDAGALAIAVGVDVARLLSLLVRMEVEGEVEALGGGRFRLVRR